MKGLLELIAALVAMAVVVFGLTAMLDSSVEIIHFLGAILVIVLAAVCVFGLTVIIKVSKKG